MKKSFLTLCAAAFINSSYASDDTQLRAGVLYDAATQSVVTMLPDGGVAAIDVNNGKAKWMTPAADKPLAIIDGRLISQKQATRPQQLTLVYQNLDGGEALSSIDLTLPEGVAPTVVDGAAHQFNIQWLDNADDQLTWTFQGGAAQGIATDEAFSQPNGRSASLSQSGLIELNTSALSAVLVNRSAPVINQVADIEQTWLDDIPGRQFISRDGQHVLVSSRIKSDRKVSYQWRLFDRSGQRLTELVTNHAYTPFLVAGQQLLIIEPATGQVVDGKLVRNAPVLKAIELASGNTSWTTQVRPITYFGPLPL